MEIIRITSILGLISWMDVSSIPISEIEDLQVNRCSVAPFARHEESNQSKGFRATATSLG